MEALAYKTVPSGDALFALRLSRVQIAGVAIGATAFFAKAPVAKGVRYAHGDFPTGILHNKEGLPMPPFVIQHVGSQ